MKVTVKLTNGKCTSLSVKWHNGHCLKTAVSSTEVSKPGLYTTTDVIRRHNSIHQDLNDSDSLNFTEVSPDNIECASAPFSIYHETEDGTPWKNFGTLIREVPFRENINWDYM